GMYHSKKILITAGSVGGHITLIVHLPLPASQTEAMRQGLIRPYDFDRSFTPACFSNRSNAAGINSAI
ncbi:MAG: hypothetical protein ABIH47_07620, partial [Candidatus Omnitrophota bacterium]